MKMSKTNIKCGFKLIIRGKIEKNVGVGKILMKKKDDKEREKKFMVRRKEKSQSSFVFFVETKL